MQSIPERLPSLSAADSEFAAMLGKFDTIVTQVQGFSITELNTLLQAGQALPIPSGLALISQVLDNFSQMAEKIPSDPAELTAQLLDGLEGLKTDLTGISGLLGPITTIIDFVAPLLNQFEFLNNSVTRINGLITDVSGIASGLDLANIAEQFEYVSRMFDIFPEVADVSPFKEFKAQIDTLKSWLTLNTADLTEHFRNQVQTLADALPTQLNNVMQAGLDTIGVVEANLPALERSVWCDPYTQALATVESIDLNNLSPIDDHLALLNDTVTQVNNVVNTLTQNAKATLAGMNDFDAQLLSQDLSSALLNILNVIGPEKPGILVAVFSQIRRIIGGVEMDEVQRQIVSVEKEVDKLIGELDLSAFTGSIQEITDRIVSAVQTIDSAMIEVATALSNLVTELQGLITSVDLPGLVSQVQAPFDQLSSTVNGLLTQVNSVQQQIQQFITDAGQGIDGLDFEALANAIGNLLSQITSVLEDPQIQQMLEATQQGIADIAQNLESVSLTPIFDQVVGDMESLKADLADVDVSQLNDILKATLAAAVAVIRQINFAEQVANALTEQFQAILGNASGLVEPLQEKYQALLAQIDQFEPGALVSEKLAAPFEVLVAELNKIEPSQILAPLAELHQTLVAQLDALNPTNLLAPLTDLHTQLLDALQSLSPQELIAPLNERLSEVTGLLNNLGIEAFINNITDSVGKINTLMGAFGLGQELRNTDFWGPLGQVQFQVDDLLGDAESKVNQFLDQLVGAVGGVDISTLQPALDALAAAITTIENHVNAPQVLTRMDSFATTLNTQNFRGCVTDLTQRWVGQKARFESFTPPVELAGDYETLKERVRALSPIVLLAAPAAVVDGVKAKVETAQAELTRGKELLVNLLAESQSQLDALLPNESTAEGFKQLLREGLEEQIGRPAKEVLRLLRTKVAAAAEVFESIKSIVLKFQAPFEALTVIPASIEAIGEALIDAKNKITGFNLNFLQDELQGVINEVIVQLEALDPAAILTDVETIYQNTLNAVQQIYPQAAVESLDTTYHNLVVQKIGALHPDQTVAEPLNTEYQKILELKERLNVDAIFDALTAKLDTLGQELEEGLDRAANAFDELLGALPSGLSVGVG